MPSVAEIIARRALSLEAVHIPHPHAQARWVATSELADPSPFLEGGEILLTTGLIDRDSDGWRQFVEQLISAGVVALGFGVGLSHPQVPAALSRAASDLALNLFIVPRPIPFIAVSRAVADLLWKSERDADRRSRQHQQQLTAVAGHGPARLVATLAQIVCGRVLLCGRDGVPLAGDNALLERARPQLARMNTAETRGAVSDIVFGSRLSLLPIGRGVGAEAYLIIESEHGLDPAHRATITTAIALLTLERAQARTELDADRRIRAGAVSLVLQSDIEGARRLLDGSAPRSLLPGGRARVVRARGVAIDVERALGRLEQVDAALGSTLAALAGTHLVVIASPATELLDDIVAALSPLEIGVGPVRLLSSLAASDHAAQQALDATSNLRPVVTWAELAERGIDSLVNPAELSAFAANLLEPVNTRDDGSDIVEALRSFLQHNGHIGPASVSMGVHRNTLRNRLATAETVLGRSLHDPQLRADLWVALKNIG